MMWLVPVPPDDRAPGDLDPEATRRRLEALYGEALPGGGTPDGTPTASKPPSPVGRPPRNQPVTPPAQQRAQYHVAAPDPAAPGDTTAQPPTRPARTRGRQPAGPASPKAPDRSEPQTRRRGRRGPKPPLPKAKWFRPKLRWFTLYLPLLLLLVVAGAAFWAWRTFDTIDRVSLGDALTPAAGRSSNYLIVGSDSRANIDQSAPDAAAFGPDVAGERADTLILMRVGEGTPTMMSVPRDLWVTNAATGQNLEGVRVVLASAYYDPRYARLVAEKAGVRVLAMANQVGAVGGADTYLDMIGYDVRVIAEALAAAGPP